MSAYVNRVLDVSVGLQSSPIFGVRDAPALSIDDCVSYAKQREPLLAFESLGGVLFCAHTFAEELQDELLTQDEVAAVHIYTQQSPWYPTLNERLRERDRELLKPFFPYIRLLLTALYKLPPWSGMLYRGVKKDLRAEFKPKSKKIWWAFSSSATRLEVLQSEQFLGKTGDRTLFHIATSMGVDIQRYSAFSNEAEILLLPGTCVVVDSVLDAGNGLVIVQLKEQIVEGLLDFERSMVTTASSELPASPKSTMIPPAAAVTTPVSAPVVPMTVTAAAKVPVLMAGPADGDKAVVSALPATQMQMAVHKPPVVLYFHYNGCFQFDGTWTTVKTTWKSNVTNRICTMAYDGTECVVLMDDDGQLSVYNPITSKLSQPLPQLPKQDRADMASLLCHKQVLYVFGWDKDMRGIYALQPSATQWQRVCASNTWHAWSVVGVIGDKIYISDMHSTECYGTATNKCVMVSGQFASLAGSCVYGGKLYVAGGDVGYYGGGDFNTLRCYDPVTDKWTQLADMPTARSGLSLLVYQNRLWAIGGSDGKQRLTVVESYDVAQNKWRSEPSLPSGAAYAGAVVI